MLSLTDFLTMLPNVKPRKARAQIVAGKVLTPREQLDLHRRDTFYGIIDVGPDAAAGILRVYQEGRLPMKVGLPTVAPLAEAYVRKRDELLATLAERSRRQRALHDTSCIVESDFCDHQFIDAVFLAHLGPGEGKLTLAGIEVAKTVRRYLSNSGKTNGWAVQFSWTGLDGIARESGKQPPQATNRRNDASRNWGLPE